jgi:hypothetical protein
MSDPMTRALLFVLACAVVGSIAGLLVQVELLPLIVFLVGMAAVAGGMLVGRRRLTKT